MLLLLQIVLLLYRTGVTNEKMKGCTQLATGLLIRKFEFFQTTEKKCFMILVFYSEKNCGNKYFLTIWNSKTPTPLNAMKTYAELSPKNKK